MDDESFLPATEQEGWGYLERLFCIADGTGFTYNRNFNLPRISHLVLNLFGDFVGKLFRFLIANLVGTDDYA